MLPGGVLGQKEDDGPNIVDDDDQTLVRREQLRRQRRNHHDPLQNRFPIRRPRREHERLSTITKVTTTIPSCVSPFQTLAVESGTLSATTWKGLVDGSYASSSITNTFDQRKCVPEKSPTFFEANTVSLSPTN